eukprot:CAMPEP_0203744692 /NCGR_PEP_ID=MMETSP0098-20131031/678_1 /ASSEMBLY_ACC=CAM_ASM_000208 /TAXON_ID=96639 /ORGANISM=" , Strain NY0313808BC1" /LENGTH=1271 /DNA_ID=CAMNT_0050632279 /DNA_START=983 /DNA_END=4795 /DNA_ORIENTATION=+
MRAYFATLILALTARGFDSEEVSYGNGYRGYHRRRMFDTGLGNGIGRGLGDEELDNGNDYMEQDVAKREYHPGWMLDTGLGSAMSREAVNTGDYGRTLQREAKSIHDDRASLGRSLQNGCFDLRSNCNGSNCVIDLDLLAPGAGTLYLCDAIKVARDETVVVTGTGKTLECIYLGFWGERLFYPFHIEALGTLTILGSITVQKCNGVFSLAYFTTLHVEGAYFYQNSGSYTFGLPISSSLIQVNSTKVNMHFENSKFYGNRGSNGGILDASASNLNGMRMYMFNCSVRSNWARSNGGVFFVQQNQLGMDVKITIENTIFRDNKAYGHGGVFYYGSNRNGLEIDVTDSVFQENRADYNGGVLYFGGELNPNLEFSGRRWNIASFANTDFKKNSAINGGVLLVEQGMNRVHMNGCTIQENEALNSGGVLSFQGYYYNLPNNITRYASIEFVGGEIKNNKCEYKGGVFTYYNFGRLSFRNVHMESNSANEGGVGFVSSNPTARATIYIDSCTVMYNNADKGGVFAYGEIRPSFRNHFELDHLDHMEILDSSFRYNSAALKGGVFHADGNISIVTSGSQYLDNHAAGCGAFYIRASSLDVSGTEFTRNRATMENGGAICAMGGAVSVFHSVDARENVALQLGGFAFHRNNSRASLQASNLTSNTAGRFGGALAMESDASITATNCTFYRNSMLDTIRQGGGGAIAMLGTLNSSATQPLAINISLSTFSENQAFSGGAVFFKAPNGLQVQGLTPHATKRQVSLESKVTILRHGHRVAVFSGCKFTPGNKSLSVPFETTPVAIRFHHPGSTGLCDSLGEALTPESTMEVRSGGKLPTFCVVALDGFNAITRCAVDQPLHLDMDITGKEQGDLEMQHFVPRLITLESAIPISGTVIFAKEGKYKVRVFPFTPLNDSEEGTDFDAQRFQSEFKLEVTRCREGEMRCKHSESSIFKCTDTTTLVPQGYYLPDPADCELKSKCPLGSSRPGSRHARKCYNCPLGSVSSIDRSYCEVCRTRTLSWDPKRPACNGCPNGANCTGGAAVVPMAGYYHTSLSSYQFHKCSSEEACSYNHRQEKLMKSRLEYVNELSRRILNSSGAIQAATSSLAATEYMRHQCSSGYTGPLCGSCEAGFQRATMTTCRKCASKQENVAKLTLTLIGMIIVMVILINRAFKKRDPTSNVIKNVVSFFQQVAVVSTYKIGWPRNVHGLMTFASGLSSGDISTIGCLLHHLKAPSFLVEAVASIYIFPTLLMILVPSVMCFMRHTSPWGRERFIEMSW